MAAGHTGRLHCGRSEIVADLEPVRTRCLVTHYPVGLRVDRADAGRLVVIQLVLHGLTIQDVQPDQLAELHAFGLFVAADEAAAKAMARKQLLAGARLRHKDDLMDVDDCLVLREVDGLHVQLRPDPQGRADLPEWQGIVPSALHGWRAPATAAPDRSGRTHGHIQVVAAQLQAMNGRGVAAFSGNACCRPK